MAIEVALGSHENVCEVLGMLDIIESTRFQDLPDMWHDRTLRAMDYHPGPPERAADYLLYDPWIRQKIGRQTAWSCVSATRVAPDDVVPGWVHDDETVDGTLRDESRDFIRYTYGDNKQPASWLFS